MRLLLQILILTLIAFSTHAQEVKNLYVEVKQAKVRVKPLHWSKASSDVSYGDKLEQLDFQNPWYKVKSAQGATGYIHSTAVTKKAIQFKGAGPVDAGVAESDIVLAGKGFNKEIEAEYSGDSPDLNYEEVNKLEARNISADRLSKFIIEGQLNSEGVYTHVSR